MYKELIDRIYKFLDDHAIINPYWDGVDRDFHYTSDDAQYLFTCAQALTHNQMPPSCCSRWESGGYEPFNSESARAEHDAIIAEIKKIIDARKGGHI